jgi:hypothetical protein
MVPKLNLEKRVFIEDPMEVLAEVKNIVLLMFSCFDFHPFQKVFYDILRLFEGKYPGYRKCNTHYHDFNHTTDCLLVMARLIHGAKVTGVDFLERDVNLGLIAALMHDTGYIQTEEDQTGTGGKYTLIHISRSIAFMGEYFLENGYSVQDFRACCNFLKCTGLDVRIGEIKFPSWEHEILGKMLGAADLIGQMADANYVAKLPFLFHEFEEGGVPGFHNEMELLKKTPNFWETVKMRFARELGQVDRYLRHHFRARWGVDQDLYHQAIERNIDSIQLINANCKAGYPTNPCNHLMSRMFSG